MSAVARGFENRTHWALEGMWVVLAIVAHALFIGGMPRSHERSAWVAFGNVVDMAIVEEEAETEEVEEPAAVKPAPPRRSFRATKKASAPKAPPPAQETPAAFDNVVLTEKAHGDSSWSAEQASGKSVEGPIGSPNAVVTGESKMGVAGGVVGGGVRGVVIDTGDLSREMFAPPFNRTPKRLKPNAAGTVGVEGEAFVRLQVSAEGVPSNWQVIAETPRGYELGEACIKTLRREAWQAPLGEDAKPITARIIYRCGYEIWY
jgi:hypothetical protein